MVYPAFEPIFIATQYSFVNAEFSKFLPDFDFLLLSV